MAGFWSLSRPPGGSEPEAVAVGNDGQLEIPPTVQTISDPSAERRAWDAALAEAQSRPPDRNPAVPQPVSPAAPLPLEDVVSRVMPAVVLIETSSGRGSGFFVRPDTLVTNVHVVKDDGIVTLRRIDGTTASARVDRRSPEVDIAILKVMAPVAGQAVIPMGTADMLRPGQEVFTIGSALGTLQNSVTRGIVSGVRRSGRATLVQTDAAANPGNSGGPLLDRRGVAIGITTLGYRDQQGLNFAVAIDHARAILDGRSPGPIAAPLAMNELKTLTPAVPSESERRLDAGQRAFLAAAARVSSMADTLDQEWKRFRQSCYTAEIPGSFSHEWLVMLSPRPVTASQVSAGSCAAFLAAFQHEANRARSDMRTALEEARRAGVLPGVVRDTLRASRLEFDGWDR